MESAAGTRLLQMIRDTIPGEIRFLVAYGMKKISPLAKRLLGVRHVAWFPFGNLPTQLGIDTMDAFERYTTRHNGDRDIPNSGIRLWHWTNAIKWQHRAVWWRVYSPNDKSGYACIERMGNQLRLMR